MKSFLLVISLLFSLPVLADEHVEELMAKPLSAVWPKWVCTPHKKYTCSIETCLEGPPVVGLFIDFPRHLYKRCDKKGCDSYLFEFQSSGYFTTINRSNGGAEFIKIRNDGKAYMEVISFGFGVIIYYGTCKKK